MTKPPRHFCPVFISVFGYPALKEKLGRTDALHAVERCFNRIERTISGFGGRIVKRSGEQIMAVFDTAEAGMLAACEMQDRVDRLPLFSGIKLTIGIGLHYGPEQEKDNDASGPTVLVAARLVKLARDGQILASETAVNALPPQAHVTTRLLNALTLKLEDNENIHLHAVIWQPQAPVPAATGVRATARTGMTTTVRLRLVHTNREILLSARRPVATLGRDPKSDLPVKDQRASRNHCLVELRGDVFVLVDKSSNGTFVKPEGEEGFWLKHGEAELKGRGRLSFGQAEAQDVDDLVAYESL